MINAMKNLTFILGGARSGKSAYAEKLASAAGDPVLYIATAEILDEEMRRRIEHHRERRPANWQTLEAPRQIASALQLRLNEAEFKVCLLDCLSVWTSNIILSLPEDCDESTAWAAVQAEIDALLDVVQNHANLSWIFVSNETGMGVVPDYPLGRLYRDVLGRANQYMAAYAGSVYWMAAGIPVKIK